MDQIKRPSLSETDDDLLKEQEFFLKERKKPAVQVISCAKENAPTESLSRQQEDSLDSSILKQNIDKKPDVVVENIVSDVKERVLTFSQPFVFQAPPYSSDINKLIKENVTTKQFVAKGKARSIFVQMLKSSKDEGVAKKQTDVNMPVLIDGSGLTTDNQTSELSKIHEENLAKLTSMSKDEILEHQEQLKNYLKPEIVDFIRNKKVVKKNKPAPSTTMQKNEFKPKNENNPEVKIIKKEGKEDCDALILDNIVNTEKISSEKESISSAKRKKDFEIPRAVTQLVEGNENGLWRNMNKIEKEKLEWMTDLPEPKPIDLKTGFTARFDFEGKILSREVEIPTYQGLHHHGNEPEVAGYSLEELFLLARSSLQSQRVTALNTISHILENNWCGMMDSCFEKPLLPLLLNAGIVPLLRWSLDDVSLSSVAATIAAIHSLLISKADEACLSKTFCWLNGHITPYLEPQGLDETNIVLEELTDSDLIKLDVVKGFLRIDILPRFGYILKVMCPPPLVCNLVLEICARLAQHSPKSALEVSDHPGFLDLVFEKFLPLNWKFTDSTVLTDTVNYSCPTHSALKLLRILSSSSREMAINLLEKYDLMSNITFYLTIQPVDGTLPAQEVQLLVIETLKTWHCFLCYGIGLGVFLDIFPIFLKQIDFCYNLNLTSDTSKHVKDLEYAAHLFKAFEAISVITSELKDSVSSAAINVVFKKGLLCMKKWIWQFSQEKVSASEITLLSACMNFIVTYCRKSHEGLTCDDWEPCSATKEAFEKALVPAMRSHNFQECIKEFRSFSLLLCPEINGNKRDDKTLISLGTVLYGDDVVPNLRGATPLPLLTSCMNYVLLYKTFFQNSNNDCLQNIFNSSVLEYLKAVSSKKLKSSCWFLSFETYYVYELIQLSTFISDNSVKCYDIAISLLDKFPLLQECVVDELFNYIIFNQEEVRKSSQTLQVITVNEDIDLQDVMTRLPVIAQCFTRCLLKKETVYNSSSLLFRKTDIASLFYLSTPSLLILNDWCFMPIYKLYQQSKQKKGRSSVTSEEILQITSCLQWIYLCHAAHLSVLKDIPASVEFYYLCMVFLLDEDLFRDTKIKVLLLNVLKLILKQKKLNLSKLKWNDINNFNDIYLELLVQYEAVSYGDNTFGCFLSLPLQQQCPNQWKKFIFFEHTDILRFLGIPLSEIPVPLENFLEPIETNLTLLIEYYKALISGNLNNKKCPLLYLMAVHHIHSFIFLNLSNHAEAQKTLLSKVLKSKKDLQKKILLYNRYDKTCEYGFTMSENLSTENQIHLDNILGEPVHI